MDFETFTIEGTTSTSEGPVTDTDAAAGCNTCTDSFTVTVRKLWLKFLEITRVIFVRSHNEFVLQSTLGDNRTINSSFVWSKYRTTQYVLNSLADWEQWT